MLTDDAYNQPGGFQKITYRDHMIVAPLDHIKQALHTFGEMPMMNRAMIMKSVNIALEDYYPNATEQEPSTDPQPMNEDMLLFCQDLVIWFANEIIEGRAALESSVH